MVPNASDLARRRSVFVGCVRIIAVLAFGVGFTPVAMWFGIGVAEGSLFEPYNLPPLVFGLIVVGASAALWFMGGPLAALALPHKRGSGCPACGYDVRDAPTARCPECGLLLTDEFRADTVAPGPSHHPAARLAIAQGLMAGVARLLAAVAFLPLGCGVALSTIALVNAITNDYSDKEEYAVFGVLAMTFAAGTLLCLVPWVFPGWVGRRLAPAHTLARSAPPPPSPSPPPIQPRPSEPDPGEIG